jgi:hypothetical protein
MRLTLDSLLFVHLPCPSYFIPSLSSHEANKSFQISFSSAFLSSNCSLFIGLGEFGRFFLQAAGECGHAGLIKTGGHSRPRQTLR